MYHLLALRSDRCVRIPSDQFVVEDLVFRRLIERYHRINALLSMHVSAGMVWDDAEQCCQVVYSFREAGVGIGPAPMTQVTELGKWA